MFSQKAQTFTKKKVLIIEEDVDIADMLTHLMELLGYESVLSNHLCPIADIIKVAPDLILLDHQMRNGLGAIVCKKLKETLQTKDIPVIMTSASQNILKIADESGAEAAFIKPFDINRLELKIRNLLTDK